TWMADGVAQRQLHLLRRRQRGAVPRRGRHQGRQFHGEFDGTSKQVSFTIHGANDAAVIGSPTVADGTEDTNVANGNLTATGAISISDTDQNQAFFLTGVSGAAGNLGSLTLAANGSYTYTVALGSVPRRQRHQGRQLHGDGA